MRVFPFLYPADAQPRVSDGAPQISHVNRTAVVLNRRRVVLGIDVDPPHAAKLHERGCQPVTGIFRIANALYKETLRLRPRAVAGILDGGGQNIRGDGIRSLNDRLLRRQVDARGPHAGHVRQSVFHVHHARRARHPGDAKGNRLHGAHAGHRFYCCHTAILRLPEQLGTAAPHHAAAVN